MADPSALGESVPVDELPFGALPFGALPAGPRTGGSSPVASATIDAPFLSDALDLPAGSRFSRRLGLPGSPSSPGRSGSSGRSGSPGREPAEAAEGDQPPRLAFETFDPGRRGLRALIVVTVLVVAVSALLVWWARPRPVPVPNPAILPSAEAVAVSSDTVVVAVAGRVRRPGLVQLPAGSRVADAIEAAGGVLPGTDLSFVNLARKVSDGELITIGVTPPPGVGAVGPGGLASGPINLNTATLAQLDTLPGVGPVLAQRILDYRAKHGRFTSVAELRQVDGVGDARFEQLRDLVTV